MPEYVDSVHDFIFFCVWAANGADDRDDVAGITQGCSLLPHPPIDGHCQVFDDDENAPWSVLSRWPMKPGLLFRFMRGFRVHLGNGPSRIKTAHDERDLSYVMLTALVMIEVVVSWLVGKFDTNHVA